MTCCSRHICAAILMLTAAVPAASAAGIDLAWNDCFVEGGTFNRSFACNTNSGSNTMVVSFNPPDGIGVVVGGTAVIDLISATSALPSWWLLGPGGCREGALRLEFGTMSQGCPDPWAGSATGTYSYTVGPEGRSDVARIVVSWTVPDAQAVQLEPGWEYFAFRLVLDNVNTLGGGCSGCQVPICIGLNAMCLHRAGGMSTYPIYNPLNNNLITWQGGAIPGGCPGTDGPGPHFPPYDCLATPVINRSWGHIKGLYR
ncbi:MAG TPA: hypothetical protein VJY35_14495 [Candidatus Eisenbacteria bacterium]|nr:hypothetical protein [Candidatus Eisenbacteria bacterium]